MIKKSDFEPLLRSGGQGFLLSFHVQPRASKTGISGIYGTSIKIALTAPPVDGKANAELCKTVANLLGIAKSSVQLVSGMTSREKTVRILNASRDMILKAFCDE